jgi:hypothetical protein
VKEFTRFDKEPERFQKYVVEQAGGRSVTVDVGYERFLAPEIFFNPEIHSSDFLTPLPNVVDTVIQSSPIDVRRGLYKVQLNTENSHINIKSSRHLTALEYRSFRRFYSIQRFRPPSPT